MASLDLCTLTLPIEKEVEHIIIDRYSDIILTLRNPLIDGSPGKCVFQFQVSSEVLRFGSWYFHGAFKHEWLETQLQTDGKYHFSCTDFDVEALYILLLTMHKETLYRLDDDY